MSGPGATCAATGGDALLDTLAISAKCAETVTNSSRAERLDWADVVLVDLAAWQSDRARRLRAQGAVHFEVQRRALEGGSAELAAEFRQRAKYLRKRGSLEAADRASHRAAAFERPAPPGTTATPPPFELWDRVIENEEGGTEVVRIPVSRWHAARARGLELWRARLQNCGQEFHSLRLDCGTCGHVRHLSLGCGVEALCAVCRDRRARQWRKEFERGRELLEKVTAEQGLANGYRSIRGRFVTLTAPDVGALEERIALRALAWRKFSRRLSRWTLEGIHAIATQRAGWFTEEQLRRLCHYVRVEEWTPGRDHHGHPHFHIWYHGPWLSADEVHDGWRADVLSTARERFPHLVAQLEKHERWQVDVRAAGPDVAHELAKYLVKDWSDDSAGTRCTPRLFARLVIANAGRRRRQCSSGFKEFCEAAKHPPECPCCGGSCDTAIVQVDRFSRGACSDFQGGACDQLSGQEIGPPPEAPPVQRRFWWSDG